MLHPASGPAVLISVPVGKGQGTLWSHLANVHGIQKCPDEEKKEKKQQKAAAKKPKPEGDGEGTLTKFIVRGVPAKTPLSRAVFKYVVMAGRPFNTVASAPFIELLKDTLQLSGVSVKSELKLVVPNTMKNWITENAALTREAMKKFWRDNLHEKFFAISCDEKKSVYRGVAQMDIVMHTFLRSAKEVRYVSVPLAITEMESKTVEGQIKALKGTLSEHGLAIRWMVSLVADEADRTLAGKLERRPGVGMNYIADVPHRVSTAVKHAAMDSGLMRRANAPAKAAPPALFEKTEAVVNAVKSRYGVRQIYNAVRAEDDFKVNNRAVLELTKWSDTRLIGALHAGFRFSINGAVLQETASRSAAQQKINKSSSFAKFPHDLTAELDTMVETWKDVSEFAPVLNDMVVTFSADKYPRLSDLFCASLMLKLHVHRWLNENPPRKLCDAALNFARALETALDKKFDEDFNNLVVCAAVLTDVRYRNFDPTSFSVDSPEVGLTMNQFAYLHAKVGDKILMNATKMYYELWPDEYDDEATNNPTLKNFLHTMEIRGFALMDDERYKMTRFYKQATAFCALERDQILDSTTGQPITFGTDSIIWQWKSTLFPMLQKLAFATQLVPASQIATERLWKKLGEVVTKKRGKMTVETGNDQVMLKEWWKVGSEVPELGLAGVRAPSLLDMSSFGSK